MRPAYYNEIEPFACEWLQRLMDDDLIVKGHIDSRSITDVTPDDLSGYGQCHFFAGIGGWSLAFRLAGVPDEWAWWSGSCPCQPYSSAGKQKGDADPRNLWPAFFRLIEKCRPPVVCGEQVSSAIRHGWLDGVCGDLETADYACWAAVLGAHSVGAPHIRQRLFWMGESNVSRPYARHFWTTRNGCRSTVEPTSDGARWLGNAELTREDVLAETSGPRTAACKSGCVDRLANTNLVEFQREPSSGKQPQHEQDSGAMRCGQQLSKSSFRRSSQQQRSELSYGAAIAWGDASVTDRLADAQCDGGRIDEPERGPEGRTIDGRTGEWSERLEDSALSSSTRQREQQVDVSGSSNDWSDHYTAYCRDGKARRVGTGVSPLAHGVPVKLGPVLAWLQGMGTDASNIKRMAKLARSNRVGRLRAYGNAIIPQLAAEFVKAYLSLLTE